jgi:glycosyltransferase involved in cell wall biosynthesis
MGTKNHPIYVDATSALLNFAESFSGIPRVEKFIFKCALNDSDPGVKIVRLIPERGTYEEVRPWEKRSLVYREEDFSREISRGSWGTAFLSALRRIQDNPGLGRSSDRHYAHLVTRKFRLQFLFYFFKLVFRAYRVYCRLLRREGLRPPDVDTREGILLLSDVALTGPQLPKLVRESCRRAFICHDLIPILKPDFLDKPAQAKRFTENINILLNTPGTTVVCTSKSSQSMMGSYLDRSQTKSVPVHRFLMPSILYEKAKKMNRTSALKPKEPYVLFCATVEIRKNHLLLARVWKQALEEGVKLPKLICVGKWGWGSGKLRDYLRGAPELSERMVFTGQVSDLELIDYYRGAMFGVMPSLLEGWGLGASECLDFGVPVIISTTPALQEATHGIMPALQADHLAAWYAEVRKMTENKKYRLSLKANIREYHRATTTQASWESIKRTLRRA